MYEFRPRSERGNPRDLADSFFRSFISCRSSGIENAETGSAGVVTPLPPLLFHFVKLNYSVVRIADWLT